MRKILGIGLCLVVGLSAVAMAKDTASDGVVDNLEELRDLFTEHQADWIELALPGEATLFQDYGLIVPFRANKLPRDFRKRLVGEYLCGVPVFRITCIEDWETRQIILYDTVNGTELWWLEADPLHDPYAFLRWKFDLSGLDSLDGIDPQEILRLDSSKIAADFILVEEAFYADLVIAQEQQRLDEAAALAMVPRALSLPVVITNLVMGIDATNGMAELEIGWPVDFSNRVEIFSCDNLLSNDWRIISPKLETLGLGSLEWLDENSTNLSFRTYRCGDADTDTDGDTIQDAREIVILGTNPDLADSDGDGLEDGQEVYQPYTVDATAFEWEDIEVPENAVTNFTDLDDGYAPAEIGFDFNFHENTFSNLYICNNGFLCFGAPDADYSNEYLPDPSAPGNLVAVLWDDLLMEANTNAAVYMATLGTSPAQRSVVTWKDIPFYSDETARLTFQVELQEAGDIICRYLDLQNGTEDYADGSSATVGIQNGNGTDGTLWSHNTSGSVTNGLAVRFHYAPTFHQTTDPNDWDSDNDGMDDGFESSRYYLDPNDPADGNEDQDADELSNLLEYQIATNPNNWDSDNDGLGDWGEYTYGLNPTNADPAELLLDSDGDGFTNNFEVATWFLDPFDPEDADEDQDNDGLGNLFEYENGLDMEDPDMDDDGLLDGDELFGDGTHGDTDGLITDPFLQEPVDVVISNSVSEAVLGVPFTTTVSVTYQASGLPVKNVEMMLNARSAGLWGSCHAGAIVETYGQPSLVRIRTDASGVYSSDVMPLEVGRIGIRAGWTEAELDASGTNVLASTGSPFRQASWSGVELAALETNSCVQVRVFDVAEAIKGTALANLAGSSWDLGSNAFEHVTIGREGYLLLGQQSAVTNVNIDIADAPDGLLAPFMDELVFRPESRIYADWFWGNEPCFVVEWDHMGHVSDPEADLSFQVQLWQRSGMVRFAYAEMEGAAASNGNARVGMKFSSTNHYEWSGAAAPFSGIDLADQAAAQVDVVCRDHDGDWLDKDEEQQLGTDPMHWDSDTDQMADGWEAAYASVMDPLADDAALDGDGDGYRNIVEYFCGTRPDSAASFPDAGTDHDFDGMDDDWEVSAGLNTNSWADALEDADHDGYPNAAEIATGGDPLDATATGDNILEPGGEYYAPTSGGNHVPPGKMFTEGSVVPFAAPQGAGAMPLAAAAGGGSNGGSPLFGGKLKAGVSVEDLDRTDDSWDILLDGVQIASCRSGLNEAGKMLLDAGQTYTYTINRVETGQFKGTDEYRLTFDDPEVADTQEPAWVARGDNSPREGVAYYNGESPPDVSGLKWEFDVPKIEMITPAGDPVNFPTNAVVDGQNEFTFLPGNPGVLTMNLKALVTPSGVASQIVDRCHFEVDAIGSSTMSGNAANPTANGDYLEATVTFTGLPYINDSFGTKYASIHLDGNMQDESVFEVFFNRDASNNPEGTFPNYIYYWLQTIQQLPHVPVYVYDPAASNPAYQPAQGNVVVLNGDEATSYTPPYASTPLTGIDNFAWTLMHENQHYNDWVNYWNIGAGLSDWYAGYGGVLPHENKDPNIGGVLGGEDYLPNNIEDVNLNSVYDAGDLYDWEDGLTGNPHPMIANDAEDYTVKRHMGVVGDHNQDWSNPGMQHKTMGNYND